MCLGMETGWDGTDIKHGMEGCITRRIGNGLPVEQFPAGKGINWCKEDAYGTATRIYELEVLVNQLQYKIEHVDCASNGTGIDKISQLEQENNSLKNRVLNLEGLFNQLNGLLVQVVQMLINIKK